LAVVKRGRVEEGKGCTCACGKINKKRRKRITVFLGSEKRFLFGVNAELFVENFLDYHYWFLCWKFADPFLVFDFYWLMWKRAVIGQTKWLLNVEDRLASTDNRFCIFGVRFFWTRNYGMLFFCCFFRFVVFLVEFRTDFWSFGIVTDFWHILKIFLFNKVLHLRNVKR
jgi:hypothetical protein